MFNKKDYYKQWQQRNKETINLRNRKWQQDNKQHIKKYKRGYYKNKKLFLEWLIELSELTF
jgi:hypothetical protein